MNIGLFGFGAMNKKVKEIAEARGHQVSVIESAEALGSFDLIIDHSHADAVKDNVSAAVAAKTPIVVGTTGWYDNLSEIEEIVKEGNGTMLWSSNFSIGVHAYFKMVQAAAKIMNKIDEYDVWGNEIHHHNKVDSPSGTAKSLEKILLEEIDRKTMVVEEKLDRKIEPHEIHFSSTRGGAVNFAHTIGFDSEADTITVTHSARNRGGYALGAVKAAEWLARKEGFYSMDDYIADVL
jgi:4-hydroxy-tetrahydrodipicolinate reductase